jgi:hypothetical protein
MSDSAAEWFVEINKLPDNDRLAIIKVAEQHNALAFGHHSNTVESQVKHAEYDEILGTTSLERATSRAIMAKARVCYRYLESHLIFLAGTVAMLVFIADRVGIDTKLWAPTVWQWVSHGWGIK